MQANVYWIETGRDDIRIGIAPRPRGWDWLEDEARNLREADVDIVVSLLTEEENQELGLVREAACCQQEGISFLSLPIPDMSTPSSSLAVGALVEKLEAETRAGRSVAIHCRGSIGRSSLIAACLLVQWDLTAEAAFNAISRARGCPVPETTEQRRWVERFAAQSRRESRPG